MSDWAPACPKNGVPTYAPDLRLFKIETMRCEGIPRNVFPCPGKCLATKVRLESVARFFFTS